MAATKLGPGAFERHVRPIKAQVGGDVDAATLAAKVVARVVERSEVRKKSPAPASDQTCCSQPTIEKRCFRGFFTDHSAGRFLFLF